LHIINWNHFHEKTFRINREIESIFSLFATKFKNLNYSHFLNLHLTHWKNTPKFEYLKSSMFHIFFYGRKPWFFWEISFNLSAHVENIACFSQHLFFTIASKWRNRLQFLVTGFLNSLVFSVVFYTIKIKNSKYSKFSLSDNLYHTSNIIT